MFWTPNLTGVLVGAACVIIGQILSHHFDR